MRSALFLSVAVMALGLTGCGNDAGEPGPPVPLKSFVLHDVQGLFGGEALWVGEDNSAIVQVVGAPPPAKSGLWEKRYKLTVTKEQRAEFERLVGAHDFLRLKIRQRDGIPDEEHPIIVVTTKAGDKARVRKWANDKNPRFDPLYSHLLAIAGTAEGRELIHEGEYDGNWTPDGFEKLW
jgi:hypothetical protein